MTLAGALPFSNVEPERSLLAIAGFPFWYMAACGFGVFRRAALITTVFALVRCFLLIAEPNAITLIRDGQVATMKPAIMDLFQYATILVALTLLVKKQELQEAILDEARRAESRFLSNMSHEIRNPLNGVAGLIKLALEEKSLAAAHAHLKTASVASEHLAAIVNDVLDFKKLESGEFVLRISSFDYWEMLNGTRSPNQHIAAEKNITFDDASSADSLPRFLIGDAVRLNQIALNLISNAVKYTPENGRITVLSSYDFDSQTLTYSVQDTGMGMSKETISRLFERYYQGNEAPLREQGGTGLGLAIVKGLLDQMDGSIAVESELGKGTRVTIRAKLPVDLERENAWRNGPQDAQQRNDTPARHLGGITVLCVDDDATNLAVMVPLLDRAGADVRVAKSGNQALAILSRSEVDIVMSDISMPGMDGIALLREIYNLHPDTPVIAVTGNVLEEDVRRYLASGFVEVLDKPFEFDQCIDAITRHAKKSRGPP